jgi:vancomycin permeability regulator SanA
VAERPRRRRWLLRIIGVVLLIAVGYVTIIAVQVVSASRQDQREQVDAIVVMGAAQYDGTPSPALQGRLDRALELYEQGLAPEIVLTGSKQTGDRFTEAFAGYRYLTEQGVPESSLTIVDDGASTYESLAAARRVLREEGADRVLLVSTATTTAGCRASPASWDGAVRRFHRRIRHRRSAGGETGRVAVGEIIGYRRLFNQTH